MGKIEMEYSLSDGGTRHVVQELTSLDLNPRIDLALMQIPSDFGKSARPANMPATCLL
jgi:hypothetical protein